MVCDILLYYATILQYLLSIAAYRLFAQRPGDANDILMTQSEAVARHAVTNTSHLIKFNDLHFVLAILNPILQVIIGQHMLHIVASHTIE